MGQAESPSRGSALSRTGSVRQRNSHEIVEREPLIFQHEIKKKKKTVILNLGKENKLHPKENGS